MGETIRGYYWLSQSWYAEANLSRMEEVDQIMIGQYDVPDGGTAGEFSILWIRLGGNTTPYLKIYDDAWRVLQDFGDLLAALSGLDNTNPTPEQIAALLDSLGIRDLTERTRPQRTLEPRPSLIDVARGVVDKLPPAAAKRLAEAIAAESADNLISEGR